MEEGIDEIPLEDRSEQRYSRTIIAHMRVADAAFQQIYIRNFSASGFRATAEIIPNVGDKIDLKLANLKVFAGTVVWIGHDVFGVKLESPMDTNLLVHQ